jgi:FkbM family methyltransferase
MNETFSRLARRVILPIFRHVNIGNITIRHHWTGDGFRLHSFKHKGYWWHGRNRERATMRLFEMLLTGGSQVLEIGAHIGYVAQYFSFLVGVNGRVICFEPSPENIPYLRANIALCDRKNIEIVEAAAGDHDGESPFFYESITGQNSTTVADFKGLEANGKYNGLPAEYQGCCVRMRRIDSFVSERGLAPSFIKIDAEGGEFNILLGMSETLKKGPRMMVEFNMNRVQVFSELERAGYMLFDCFKKRVVSASTEIYGENVFALHARDEEGLAVMMA